MSEKGIDYSKMLENYLREKEKARDAGKIVQFRGIASEGEIAVLTQTRTKKRKKLVSILTTFSGTGDLNVRSELGIGTPNPTTGIEKVRVRGIPDMPDPEERIKLVTALNKSVDQGLSVKRTIATFFKPQP